MSNEAKLLADTVKSVHRQLRREFKTTGELELVWAKHCKNESSLQQYAKAMHMLATEHWEQLSAIHPITSRINWTWSFLIFYFKDGGLEKERSKCKPNTERPILLKEYKIKVLDVGSCYNPFSGYKELEILPIDLCPAQETVYQCDFLEIQVGERTVIEGQKVFCLARNHFHCVVFSFLLEYFPSASQRWTCCKKANKLLQEEGVLIIITPDSKAAHSNSKVMRSWREALASIGLKRIKYEKLQHAHCMAFRKSEINQACDLEHNDLHFASMMYIPQDFHNISDSDDCDENEKNVRYTEKELADGFANLPSILDE